MLGKWFEEGEELSVGEWQKIAWRGPFVRDAQILVFDEPTSALDPQAEWDVFQHIKELAAGPGGDPHQPSLLDGAHGRPHPHLRPGPHHRERHPRGADGAGRRYAEMYEVQAQAYEQAADNLVAVAVAAQPRGAQSSACAASHAMSAAPWAPRYSASAST